MLTSRTLWILSIMYFCSNAGWSVFITYDTKYLQTSVGLSGWGLHLVSGLPLFLGGVGCVLGGFLTDGLGGVGSAGLGGLDLLNTLR